MCYLQSLGYELFTLLSFSLFRMGSLSQGGRGWSLGPEYRPGGQVSELKPWLTAQRLCGPDEFLSKSINKGDDSERCSEQCLAHRNVNQLCSFIIIAVLKNNVSGIFFPSSNVPYWHYFNGLKTLHCMSCHITKPPRALSFGIFRLFWIFFFY